MTLKVKYTPAGARKARVFTASAADTPETVKNAIGGFFLQHRQAGQIAVDALVSEGREEQARELMELLKKLGA